MSRIYFTEERMVDRLGRLRAEMKVLKDEAKGIENWLKANGDGSYDGEYFSATVFTSERKTIGWKDIATKLKASTYMLETYSKVKEVVTLKLTAHKKAAA